ncbi:hypothetical protein JCM10213_008025 [Rhodosporidiobolus nylandii]
MAKLKKLHKAAPNTPTKSASVASPTASQYSASSSTIRAPSVGSATVRTSAGSSPIALRTVAAPAKATLSGAEAWGELDGLEDGSERGRTGSPAGPMDSGSIRRTPSPSSSLSLRRPTPPHSRAHTRETTVETSPTATPVFARPAAYGSAHPFPAASTSPSDMSALSHLRRRLDSDQAARETARVKQEYGQQGKGRLRKKLPQGVAARKAEEVIAKEEQQEDAEAQKNSQLVRKDGEEAIDGEQEGHVEDGEVENGPTLEKERALSRLHVDRSPSPPISPRATQPSTAFAIYSPAALFRASTCLVLAPARLTYRIAVSSSDLVWNCEVRREVLKRVSDAARLNSPPSPTELENEQPDEPNTAASHPPPSAFSTASSSSRSSQSTYAQLASLLSFSSPALPTLPTVVPRSREQATDLALQAVGVSLGLALATGLIGLAVGGMAWDKVRGRREKGKERASD